MTIDEAQLDIRRRRAYYRATHRGTKEMDWLLGRYAQDRLDTMGDGELTEFETFLAMADPELQTWLMEPGTIAASEFAELVARIRSFHGV